MKAAFLELFNLFFTFFKIGAVTFGGGYAMLPILERELITKRKWTTSEQILDYYAIGQSTPGIIAVNVSTFIGHKRRGVTGAIAATVGMVTPSIIIITIIALFIHNFESITWVQKALNGINVSVAALLTYSVYGFAKKSIKNWWGALIYIAAFVAVYFFRVSSIFVVLSAAAVGILIHFILKVISAKSEGIKSSESGQEKSRTRIPVIPLVVLAVLVLGFFVGLREVQSVRNARETQNQVQKTAAVLSETDPESQNASVLLETAPETQDAFVNSDTDPVSQNAAVNPDIQSESQNDPAIPSIPLWRLCLVFLYIGLFAVGGGLVAASFMQQSLVESFHVISAEKFYSMLAISESTPGPIGVNLATYVGTELFGVGGGIITTFCEVLPSFIVIILISRFFMKFTEKPLVKAAFSGLRPAANGMILTAMVQVFLLTLVHVVPFMESHAVLDLVPWKSWIFYIGGLLVLFKTKLHPVVLVAAGAVFGIIFL